MNTPAGPVYGPDGTFTTEPLGHEQFPPTVWQHGPLGNDGTGAAFTATVDGSGFATRYWFEYGETTAYGQTTPVRNLSEADARTHSVRELVTGLTPGRMYYFRIVAENAAGRSVGHGSGLMTYTGPRMGAPTPSPDPEPTPSPDPSPTPDPSARARADARRRAPRGHGHARPAAHADAARHRVQTQHRHLRRHPHPHHDRAPLRQALVRVTRLTTGKRLRRTVKPGVYRVTVGAVKRQVRVQ